MGNLFRTQIERGVGRLRAGHRTLGLVGYAIDRTSAPDILVAFDPMPTAVEGDIFQLALKDGRVLDCRVVSVSQSRCAVLDGARIERRRGQRPRPISRAHM